MRPDGMGSDWVALGERRREERRGWKSIEEQRYG